MYCIKLFMPVKLKITSRVQWLATTCQIGNPSSRKITEDKQLGPWLALGWVTLQV